MRRRRPLGRRILGRLNGRAIGARIGVAARRELRHAHRLFDQGQYRQAAEAYQSLAKNAESLGLLRAPTLYIQAGRARLLTSETDAGMRLLHHAFELLAATAFPGRFHAAQDRLLAELRRLGLRDEAELLQRDLEELQPGTEHADDPPPDEMPAWPKRKLPLKCDSCGAHLFPDELEPHGQGVYACGYCGSRVEAVGGE